MSQHNGVGEIHPQGAYPIREFCRRTGLSADRIRQHVPVRRIANRSFVLGEDFVAYLKQQPQLMPRRSDGFQRFVTEELIDAA